MERLFKIISILLVMVLLAMSFSACQEVQSSSGVESSSKSEFEENSSETEQSSSVEDVTEGAQLRVAMRKVDITPTEDVYLEGYGGRTEEYCANYPEDFLSDIMARIIVLEAGGEMTLHINLEMCVTDFGNQTSELYQFDLAKATGIPAKNIFLSNTHTHQSTIKLDKKAENAIEDACKDAVNNLVEVTVGIESYGTKYGISRSPAYSMDWRTPYDNSLMIIRFDDKATGEEVGMIYSIPIHNTAFSVAEGKNVDKLTCEFTGYASRYIEKQNADIENFTAMHINGFYGNSGPYFEDTNTYYAKTIEELKRRGEEFGAEIYNCYKEIVGAPADDYTIKSLIKHETMDRAANQTQAHINQWGTGETMPLEICAASFGEVAFVGVNYEPFSTIGAHLRAESPYEYLLPAANVGGWRGYIGLYETYHTKVEQVEVQPFKSPFDDRAEMQFYNYVLNALCEMKGVTYTRSIAAQTVAEQKDGNKVYTFEFAEEVAPDKIVVSFAQDSRLNCAEDFVLEIFDKDGNKTNTIEVSGNATNYLGFSMENVKAAKAVFTVSATYKSKTPQDIEVSLHAMNYSAVK